SLSPAAVFGASSTKSVKAASTNETKAEGKVLVIAAKASLRAKPDGAAKSLALLTKYTPVDLVGASGSWKKVKTASGITGYVDSASLSANNFVSTNRSGVNV